MSWGIWKTKVVVDIITHHLALKLELTIQLMCDTSDYAVGAVLGQRVDWIPRVIYYASMTLNDAQLNYSTTEK